MDKKLEIFTMPSTGVPPAPFPWAVVGVGIAGVSPPAAPKFRPETAEVVSSGKLLGHRTRVGGGCGNVGYGIDVSMFTRTGGGRVSGTGFIGCRV